MTLDKVFDRREDEFNGWFLRVIANGGRVEADVYSAALAAWSECRIRLERLPKGMHGYYCDKPAGGTCAGNCNP